MDTSTTTAPLAGTNPASRPFSEESSFFSRETVQQVKRITKIALTIITCTFFAYVTPTLFVLGAVTGFLFNEQMSGALNKMANVWSRHRFQTTLLIGAAAFLTLPPTLAVSAFFAGGYTGSWFAQHER